MPRLGFKESVVKVGELPVLHMSAEQIEPFAGTGFDQAGDQQAIDRSTRLVLSHQIGQTASVGARHQAAEPDAAAIEQVADEVEMGQFLVDDLGHRAAEIGVLHVGEHQIQRGARRLLLAVRVVDQNLRQMPVDLVEPPLRRRRL